MMGKVYKHGISFLLLAVFVVLALGSVTLNVTKMEEAYVRSDEYTLAGDTYARQRQYEQALAEYQKSLDELSSFDYYFNLDKAEESNSKLTPEFRKRKNVVNQRIQDMYQHLGYTRTAAGGWIKPDAAPSAAAAAAVEPPVTEGDFQITQNAQGGLTITGYIGKAKRVDIPATISDLPVTEIGDMAFRAKGLTALTIPNTVQIIGESAFESGYPRSSMKRVETKIQNLVIPDSVVHIGKWAFSECGIKTLTIGKGLQFIPGGAFGYNSIEELTIPDSVIEIGDMAISMGGGRSGAFQKCGIKILKLGNSIYSIGSEGFSGNDIVELTIPASLTRIGNNAFSGNKIAVLTWPASLKTIGDGAFSNNQLTTLVIPEGITVLPQYPFDKNPITSITIPPSLASFQAYDYRSNTVGFAGSFEGVPITRITLPANVAEENVKQFGDGFVNFWKLQNKKAGTYRFSNRIWTVE